MKTFAILKNKTILIYLVIAVAAVGTVKLLATHAATQSSSFDICEDTPVSGNAYIGHDHENASCGHYVSFGFQPPTNVSTSLTKAVDGVIGAVGIANTGVPGDKRLFVLTQTGKIFVSNNDGTNASGSVFLDISSKVVSGGEQGLLGLTFDPNYAQNGYFYVNYTTSGNRGTFNGQTIGSGDTIVARYTRSTASTADPNSELIIMGIDQPAANHNGGGLEFGPDGFLYISAGDGGGGGDTWTTNCSYGNGQCLNTYLGKILRVDVRQSSAAQRYAIPASNPFVGQAGAVGEIWHTGLRNPWRFSFDRKTGDMFIGDVGQNNWEEIDFAAAGQSGKNFGWRCYEGAHAYNLNGNSACNTASNFIMPIYEYNHSSGCSVTGGYIYRGAASPEFDGTYVFSDYCGSKLLYLNKQANGSWGLTKTVNTNFSTNSVTALGQDIDGELYVANIAGIVYRINITH